MNAEIRVESIDDLGDFRSLQGCWNRLLQESSADTVFLTWEWLFTWYKHLRTDGELFILRLSYGDETFGLVPLTTRPCFLDNVLNIRAVEFLGTGSIGSDYLDSIIKQGYEEQALGALKTFAERASLMLSFAQIKKDGCFVARWADHMEHRGWRVSHAKTNVCPFISLKGHSWQSYLATLGSEHRYAVRRKLRNLAKNFDVQFERVTAEPQCQETLSLLLELHNRRWHGRGGSDAFYTSSMVGFHWEFTQLALARDWLRLYVLRLDGKPAASLYGLRYGGTFYFYQSGFDPAYDRYSVGLVTMALAIKAAIEEGAEEYDLLHGDELYKFHWAKEVREIAQLDICPKRASVTVYQGAIHLNRGLRRLARRLLPKTIGDAIAARSRGVNTGSAFYLQ
jgi:CelD/BcsL family acetyltransferase involved in cellulose biosynthesis